MRNMTRIRNLFGVAAVAATILVALAAPAAAIDTRMYDRATFPVVPQEGAPMEEDPAGEPFAEPAAEKPADEADRIAPLPPEIEVIEPTFPPVSTIPPKIDSASFGIGWPAAAAVAVALLAVGLMAVIWRREPSV